MDLPLIARASTLGLAAFAAACGANGGPLAQEVGTYEPEAGQFTPGDGAAGPGPLDAYIEDNAIRVTFVRLGCAGSCAEVQAVATGGRAPYSFTWEDGTTGAVRRICPVSDTRYSVEVEDTRSTGELAYAAQTAQAAVTADVTACADGGVGGDAGACDSLAASASSSANPSGAWSYGWTPTLGGAFTLLSSYSAASLAGGVESWGQGFVSQTVADFNTTSAPVSVGGAAGASGTFSVPPHTFALGPDLSGEFTVARWTAPAAGTYEVYASFQTLAVTPSGNDVHVLHNGAVLRSGDLVVDGGANSVAFSLAVTVSAADTIDFVTGAQAATSSVAPDGDYFVGVDASVCAAP